MEIKENTIVHNDTTAEQEQNYHWVTSWSLTRQQLKK